MGETNERAHAFPPVRIYETLVTAFLLTTLNLVGSWKLFEWRIGDMEARFVTALQQVAEARQDVAVLKLLADQMIAQVNKAEAQRERLAERVRAVENAASASLRSRVGG